MKITVTQEHIDLGVTGECVTCPVALAIEDSMPDSLPYINGKYIFLGNKEIRLDGHLEVVRDFIKSFDSDRSSVEPFEFVLPI